MKIIKRNGSLEDYQLAKIKNAITLAFNSVDKQWSVAELETIAAKVEEALRASHDRTDNLQVEDIQDQVEKTLTELNYYEVLRSFILYRDKHAQQREARNQLLQYFKDAANLDSVIKKLQKKYTEDNYKLSFLTLKFQAFYKENLALKERLNLLIKAAVELTSQESPKWEFIAGQILFYRFENDLKNSLASYKFKSYYDKVHWLVEEGYYYNVLFDSYTKDEYLTAASFIDNQRNELFNYSGLDLLLNRYIIRSHNNKPLETPQEMFLGIAMHLAMKETNDRLGWVKKFYDMLSTLKVTMATPTLANARKPYHQLSSCFIDTVPDSLNGIYRSLDNFAKVSKFGGGMGMYFGKVRAAGSDIRGFKGAAGGVIRWIRLANDTAVAVDQLGVRSGAVAVYLDAWHRDLPEFLGLRTNNGDDRMKAHDIFPAVCYPDLFWKLARDNIEADWYLMCPHDIAINRGYCLEDYYGEEWEKRYWDCVNDHRIEKRVIPIKDIIRLIIKSAVETGTPFTFNRDIVNKMNPNKHKGMIYCSNLCTEIAQNMGAIQDLDQTIEDIDGQTVIVTKTKPGEFVVCNLASISLGNIDVHKENELETVVSYATRALDNVIDLNFFPVPYAKINNLAYRPIGLGVSGYHHMLAKNHISWESDLHLQFVDQIFERINYAALSTSNDIAKAKGSYAYFKGSDFETGNYFKLRNYNSKKWLSLAAKIKQTGIRNGYLLAIAPTSSTSIIAGTSAGLDPIMNRYFLEEKKSAVLPRVAPELSQDTFWYYKNAYLIDQAWSIKANGVRSRHVDQAQSMNLYITNDYTFRQILNLYILAYEQGVKTLYYIRSKSLEVEECESCAS